MPFLSKEGSAAVAPKATGGYLNPGGIPTGTTLRFALLQENWEVWLQDKDGNLNERGKLIKKPLRFDFEPTNDDIEAEFGDKWERGLNFRGDGPGPCLFNIAVPVYNHDTGSIQIFASDKSSVNRAFDQETQSVDREDDYDNILEPDWILGKEGTGLNTEYSVRTAPRKKGTDKKVQEAWDKAKKDGFDLTRLLSGTNPFTEDK